MNILFKRYWKKAYLSLEENLLAIQNLRSNVKKNSEQVEGFDEILNANHYFSLCFMDIHIIFKHLKTPNVNNREKNFFARISAHLIYEILDDLDFIFKKKFRDNIEILSDKEELKKLNLVTKKFHSYKNKNFLKLKKMRNNTFGHRHKDATVQDKEMRGINVEEMTELTSEIINIYTQFLNFMTHFYLHLMKRFK